MLRIFPQLNVLTTQIAESQKPASMSAASIRVMCIIPVPKMRFVSMLITQPIAAARMAIRAMGWLAVSQVSNIIFPALSALLLILKL